MSVMAMGCRGIGDRFSDLFRQIDKRIDLPDRKVHDDFLSPLIGEPAVYFGKVGDFPRKRYSAEKIDFNAIIFFNDDEDVAEVGHRIIVVLIVDLNRKISSYLFGKDFPVSGIGVKKIASKLG